MNRHRCCALVALLTLLLSLASLRAAEQGTKCTVSPTWPGTSITIRSSPGSAAPAVGKLQPKAGEIRELDIVSRPGNDNDWINVKTGEVNGWVNARGLECRLSPEQARAAITEETNAVIQALAGKDMDALAKYVHPVKGVRFSPSATVAAKNNVVLTPREIGRWFQIPEKRTWGANDATGEPIRLTPASYYNRFIYNRDFRRAPIVGFNTIEAKSTDRNNVWEVYPNATVVEYYFPPSVPDGNDWASLRLVYEKQEGRWFLSGVIHDAWTI